jgi:hypothetical protein
MNEQVFYMWLIVYIIAGILSIGLAPRSQITF